MEKKQIIYSGIAGLIIVILGILIITSSSGKKEIESKDATINKQADIVKKAEVPAEATVVAEKDKEPNLEELLNQANKEKDNKSSAKQLLIEEKQMTAVTKNNTKPESQYKKYSTPYVNIIYNNDIWECADNKSLAIPNYIVLPQKKSLVLVQFLEKPDYKSSVILYITYADEFSKSNKDNNDNPEDYVKYLFRNSNIKDLRNQTINKQAFIIGDIAMAGSNKTSSYFITSKNDLLYIFVETNPNHTTNNYLKVIINNLFKIK